jgi:uncharacterized DUF497 family protein
MEFEWDEAKRDSNLAKHDVDFVRAKFVLDGRPSITARSSYPLEERFITTGFVNHWFITVIWTMRGEKKRIISARRARNEEIRKYRSVHV